MIAVLLGQVAQQVAKQPFQVGSIGIAGGGKVGQPPADENHPTGADEVFDQRPLALSASAVGQQLAMRFAAGVEIGQGIAATVVRKWVASRQSGKTGWQRWFSFTRTAGIATLVGASRQSNDGSMAEPFKSRPPHPRGAAIRRLRDTPTEVVPPRDRDAGIVSLVVQITSKSSGAWNRPLRVLPTAGIVGQKRQARRRWRKRQGGRVVTSRGHRRRE